MFEVTDKIKDAISINVFPLISTLFQAVFTAVRVNVSLYYENLVHCHRRKECKSHLFVPPRPPSVGGDTNESEE